MGDESTDDASRAEPGSHRAEPDAPPDGDVAPPAGPGADGTTGPGAAEASAEPEASAAPSASDEVHVAAADEAADAIADAQAAIDEARRRVAEAPVEVVVTNHVMGLYELAAIHLSAPQPDLRAAALAIDAVAALVEGLGERLGPDATTLRDALASIRLAFVETKRRVAPPPG